MPYMSKGRGKHVFTSTHVIYRKGDGRITFTGQAARHYLCFMREEDLNLTEASNNTPLVTFLLNRDGRKCFYCSRDLLDDATIEHLLAKSHGGTLKPENLVLAHQRCNVLAANKPIIEKVKLRERMRCEKVQASNMAQGDSREPRAEPLEAASV